MRRTLHPASILFLLLAACGPDPAPSGPACGDGVEDTDELCDDGNTEDGDGCSAACELEWPSDACGNGVVDPLESCDDGNTASGDGCSPTCELESCGNGVVDPGEDCDDGNDVNLDGCPNDCIKAKCGNGVLEVPYEACEPPNTNICDANCQSLPYCGDGEVNGDEQCDDGSSQSGDGCSYTCQLEVCGDGIVNNVGTEACDDGNLVDGDGCSAACQDEACGDGVVQAGLGEQCDDGNTVGGDGCRSNCTSEGCGDGILDPGEVCDDGNAVDGDGCRNDCSLDTCNDGVTSPDERCWLTPNPYPGVSQPDGVEAGDLDADGDDDVIAWSSDTIVAYYNRRNGNLTASKLYTGAQIRDAVVGDVDMDGDLDIVASRGDTAPAELIVLVNEGGGQFTATTTMGPPRRSLVLRDLDGDSAPELVSVELNGGASVVVRKNIGAYAFGPAIVVAASMEGMVQAGDLDKDGDLDLVTYVSSGPALRLYENQGGLSFVVKGTMAIPSAAVITNREIFLAELNGDGLVDAVTFDAGQNQVAIGLNQGNFSLGLSEITTTSSGDPRLLFDVDDDGDQDILLGANINPAPPFANVLVNDGAGQFTPGPYLPTYQFTINTKAVVVDLELDGDGDIIMPDYPGMNAVVNFGPAGYRPRQTSQGPGQQSEMAIADLDGDGDLDTVAASNTGVAVVKNDGHGGLAPAIELSKETAYVVAADDLNGDGKPDLVVSASFNKLLVYFNDGTGAFGAPVSLPNLVKADREVILADLDGDGDRDVVLSGLSGSQVLVNDGAGGLTPKPSFGSGARHAVLMDVTGDGVLDLVTTYISSNGQMRAYPGDGAGGFAAPVVFTLSFEPDELAAGDVDGDGLGDLVVAPPYDSSDLNVYLFHGVPGGGLSMPTVIATSGKNRAPRVVDLNLDGRLDIAIAHRTAEALELYMQDPAGQFVKEASYSPLYGLWNVEVADMNGDTVPDFMIAQGLGLTLSSVLSTP